MCLHEPASVRCRNSCSNLVFVNFVFTKQERRKPLSPEALVPSCPAKPRPCQHSRKPSRIEARFAPHRVTIQYTSIFRHHSKGTPWQRILPRRLGVPRWSSIHSSPPTSSSSPRSSSSAQMLAGPSRCGWKQRKTILAAARPRRRLPRGSTSSLLPVGTVPCVVLLRSSPIRKWPWGWCRWERGTCWHATSA